MQDYFEKHYQATIGIDFLSKNVTLDDGRTIRLQLWDTAGQERFRSLIPSYIRDASAAIIVYDVSSRGSFESTSTWVENVRANRKADECVLGLVGNKTDLERSKHQVSTEEGEAFAEKEGAMFLEVSAKAGYNINTLFKNLAAALPEKKPESRRAGLGTTFAGGAPAPTQSPTLRVHNETEGGTGALIAETRSSCGC